MKSYQAEWDSTEGRVTGLTAFGRQVLEDLWNDLEATTRDFAGQADTTWQGIEAAALEEFVEHRARGFVGREDTVTGLLRLVILIAAACWLSACGPVSTPAPLPSSTPLPRPTSSPTRGPSASPDPAQTADAARVKATFQAFQTQTAAEKGQDRTSRQKDRYRLVPLRRTRQEDRSRRRVGGSRVGGWASHTLTRDIDPGPKGSGKGAKEPTYLSPSVSNSNLSTPDL